MAIRQPRERVGTGEWSEYDGRVMPEAEFLALDDAEETDLEYVDGVAVERGGGERDHCVLAGEIGGRLWLAQKVHGGSAGPEGRVRLPSGNYRKPDYAYWLPGVHDGDDSLPSLAVEVRPPGETMASQRRKCREYREAGVLVCWLIDPIARVVEVFEGDVDAEPLPADGVLRSEQIPGFEVGVRELFAALGAPSPP